MAEFLLEVTGLVVRKNSPASRVGTGRGAQKDWPHASRQLGEVVKAGLCEDWFGEQRK
jgi:hypothetical protein